ncbi:MAG: hypothetical protein ACRC91_19015 [Aeromonas sp.]
MMDKMREEFEAWAGSTGFTLKPNAFSNGDYAMGYGWQEWNAWKASRAALCVEFPKPKLMKTDDYHEDYGAVIFIGWDRNSDGSIAGAPPSLYFGCGWLDEGFDSDLYTHWIEAKFFNSLFTQADPDSFPEM